MLIRKAKPNQLKESDVTPEVIYRSRRRFLRNAALGLGGAGLASVGKRQAGTRSSSGWAVGNCPAG